MKLQFKQQKFQQDAANAVVNVFRGQPFYTPTYLMDSGNDGKHGLIDQFEFTGWNNNKIIPQLTADAILSNIKKVQMQNGIQPSEHLEGEYNLTIEMETGVGKTYTYIKTMYELNKAYGWSKFIVVVPSIAIREGVYKTFEVTQEHFAEEYGKKIQFFIYNSSRLTEIERFASDNSIHVMIINSQAFNAKGKDARRIKMELDEFRSRRPIDVIAKTNPIVIIDEPQSVEGEQTKKNLKDFNALLTLRYSATHKKDSIYNMVYRLDAIDAYNKKLVKKISVKGITEKGDTATEGYVYLESVNLSQKDPTATIQFDVKGKSGLLKVNRTVGIGYNLYDNSNQLEEYKNNYIVKSIDGRDDSIEFVNGVKIYAGDVIGKVDENQMRQIQIRETILSHIQKEKELFHKGIKVLSLFFIDEVAKYKQYDDAGNPSNGIYADMFEKEYEAIIEEEIKKLETDSNYADYLAYLKAISASSTHAGYFSVDKKGKMVNTKEGSKEDKDVDAYDLIMKNKELLLNNDPEESPVRFIFSHSALREGWDNPNVFQICTLKQSSSEVRKRQEVGRGLRLCVNQKGERMDESELGNDVQKINELTVIASESYDSFAKALQSELAENVTDRPIKVTPELFKGKEVKDLQGKTLIIDDNTASAIHFDLIQNGYIDRNGQLTEKYHKDKENGQLVIADEVKDAKDDIIKIIDSVFDPRSYKIDNPRSNNVTLAVKNDKLEMAEFKKLWNNINSKSVYIVHFDTDELVKKSINSINEHLLVQEFFYTVDHGSMDNIKSQTNLKDATAFTKIDSKIVARSSTISSSVKYDLIGKLVDETGLTRKSIIAILKGLQEDVFNKFKTNPEEFILKTANLINDEKATAIIEHITYDALEEKYDTDIFTKADIKGQLGVNAMEAHKHLFSHIVYDSINEKSFAEKLDTDTQVAVYVKLPNSFYISTPVGKYNPDWAIAFKKDNIKHIYFVAETKGSMQSMQLRKIEESKIHCAKEHFKVISNGNVVYDVVDSYDSLLNKVMR